MGWNFGCAIIAFDFHSVVDTLLEPERRQYVFGSETPEELASKALMDMGVVVLDVLGISTNADDAPITFDDATRRDFNDYAVGVIEGKTILVGQLFGLHQDATDLTAAYARVSAQYGDVFAFWCNDASSTYMISYFRQGTRIRFFATGPGLDENHGPRLPAETEDLVNGHDHIMAMLVNIAGRPFGDLLQLRMEWFS